MSYDPSGIYNLPPVYKATPGTTVRSEQHNAPLEDIAQALSFVLVRDGRNGMIGSLPMGGFRITNLGPGTNLTDAATVAQSALIGEVKEYALKTLPPNYLWCDGAPLPPSTPYPLLRAALLADGSPYGTDGAGNPRVPDKRGRVGAGRDNMGGTAANRMTGPVVGSIHGNELGNVGGEQAHVTTIAEMPAHNHGGATTAAGGHVHTVFGITNSTSNRIVGEGGSGLIGGTVVTSAAPDHSHLISWQGNGQAHNNVQPTIIMNYIIRAAY